MARISDFDYFLKHFDPISHPDEEGSYMYETYGSELDIVKKHGLEKGESYIWTIIDGSGANLYLVPGYHFVNRIGYCICNKPWKEGQRDLKY